MVIYYCLAIVAIIPLILAVCSIPFRLSQESTVDLQTPRVQAARLIGAGSRIVDAQKNAWEALMLFTAALFIAFANNVPPESIQSAALIFVAARILHAVVYVMNLGVPRFFAFLIAFIAALQIMATALI